MKRIAFSIFLLLLVVVFASGVSAAGRTISDLADEYRNTEDVDGKLVLLWAAVAANQEEHQEKLWGFNDFWLHDELELGALLAVQDNPSPRETDGFPEEARGKPCIVLMDLQTDRARVSADLMLLLPLDMIATSVDEAEYAIVLHDEMVKSDYNYSPPATSYHHDYYAYLVNLQSGEGVRFWYHRQFAKRYGYSNELNADPMMLADIWKEIRPGIVDALVSYQADGSVLRYGINGGNCFLQGYEGEPVHIVIPEEMDGYPVREIGAECFKDCRTLESVEIPGSVSVIRKGAFEECRNLSSVLFAEGLERIEDAAFEHTAITELRLPEGLRDIGEHAFNRNNEIATLFIPGTVEDIGSFAFYYCNKLTSVVFGEGMRRFPEGYFMDREGNVEYVYLPRSLTEGPYIGDMYEHVVVYAPEGSHALKWAENNGYETAACEDPAEMPEVRYVKAGNMDFRIINNEAELEYYDASEGPDGDEDDSDEEDEDDDEDQEDRRSRVTIPGEVSGYPVTAILSKAFDHTAYDVRIIVLPASVRRIKHQAIEFSGWYNSDMKAELYIPNPETVLDSYSVSITMDKWNSMTFFAPAGSPAEAYVRKMAEYTEDTYYFVEWTE